MRDEAASNFVSASKFAQNWAESFTLLGRKPSVALYMNVQIIITKCGYCVGVDTLRDKIRT